VGIRCCAIGYGAVARLALTAQRGDDDELPTWRGVVDAMLEVLLTP
jgi:hypothetical protein